LRAYGATLETARTADRTFDLYEMLFRRETGPRGLSAVS
jgi:hypothetical protein